METRIREANSVVSGGFVYAYEDTGYVLSEYSYPETAKTMMDVHKKEVREDGSLPPSALEIDTRTCVPFRIHKSQGVFCFSDVITTAIPWTLPGRTLYAERDNDVRYAQNDFLTQQLLAATNPFREEFSVPVFIKELVELPLLFKLAAESFIGFVGKGYLNYKFGWSQFYRDVKTLANILVVLERRIKELESLNKKGGLRRRIDLRVTSETSEAHDVPLSTVYGVSIYGTRIHREHLTYSGSVRWRPIGDFSVALSKLSTFNKAVSIIFDLEEMDAATLWNILPWSWLVDYFTEMSTFLHANLGRCLVEPYDICIMRHHRARDQYQVTEQDERVTVTGGGYHYRETKSRDVWHRNDFPAMPTQLLSFSEWKTILALFASFKR